MLIMKKLLLLLLFVVATVTLSAKSIIPTPKSYQEGEGSFCIKSSTLISSPSELMPIVDYLLEYMPLDYVANRELSEDVIRLTVNPKLGREEYRLDVTSDAITICGGDYAGVFYGVQSLFQLLPSPIYTRHIMLPLVVDACHVEDSPAFGYRASHLDVARTWSPKERILRHLDLMAYHKLNTFHFHLTDDEGWRIEIKSHPELALEGGFRGEGSPVVAIYGKWGERYGGYYTQEDLREIVEYASQRAITIIPEIDLPGHSRTIARFHPEILCDYKPNLTRSAGIDFRSAWCPSREENYQLLEDIIDEVCEIFPSEYIHIGGDEVEMSQWKRCPRCSNFMHQHAISDYAKLQEYFMSRLVDMLTKRGRRPVVWNEAINGGSLSHECLVHGWENLKACHKAASSGYPTVVMPGQYFYFDMRQSKREQGHTWAAIFDSEKVYNFSLEEHGFTPAERENIVGFECTFFSEAYVGNNPETTAYLDFMLYPRTVAFAELAWHYRDKRWQQFKRELVDTHYDRLSAMGVAFRLFPPTVTYSSGTLTASVEDSSELYYIKDGDSSEQLYTEPIATTTPELYRFRSYYRHALSPYVAHSSYYKQRQPSLKFSSSFTDSEKAPFSRLEEYRGAAWTTRTHLEGDWIKFTFDSPITCRKIELQTGYLHLPRLIITTADVEVSQDGVHFTKIGELYGGSITIHPTHPIKSIRVTATSSGNGEDRVVVQSLRIF